MVRISHFVALAAALVSSPLSGEELAAGQGQLGANLERIQIPNATGQFYLVQRTADKTLFLTPNESFFPQRGPKLTGKGTVRDVANLNGGNSFATIENWSEGKEVEWGCYFAKTGAVHVELSGSDGSQFSAKLGDGDFQSFRPGAVEMEVPSIGRHSLILRCDEAKPSPKVAFLKLTGEAVDGAGVIRKRWRPAAAHTKFTNSTNPDSIRLWIMEMDAVPGELDFYCPITTPFGYYGPTWKADGTVNTGFNFSLWSFGRGASEPPIEQLSHLVAIGNPEAEFSGFNHEGTGVKIRGWEPLEGRAGQRQAIALRVEPGADYDTYHSYFFASDEQRWRLFGSGKKWNKGKPVASLWVGSFVEVPGPPPVQRTGPYVRTMRYRGWVMNEDGEWSALDRMGNGNVDKETGLTHTDRGTTENGWFYLATGGWTFRNPPSDGEPIALDTPSREEISFLDPEDLAYLQTIPSSIKANLIERRSGRARITFEVLNPGNISETILYFGSEEGLTFVDRWPHAVPISEILPGENQFVFDDPDPTKPLFARLYLKNEEGQFWSVETIVAKP